MSQDWTTCKKCGRVVYPKDVDADGRCCFCPVVRRKSSQDTTPVVVDTKVEEDK